MSALAYRLALSRVLTLASANGRHQTPKLLSDTDTLHASGIFCMDHIQVGSMVRWR